MSDRILWNRRPASERDGGDIDEIVLHGVTVHIEQMSNRCWWIGIDRPDGTDWHGNFIADSRGRMRFVEQENNGIEWEHDATHEVTTDQVRGGARGMMGTSETSEPGVADNDPGSGQHLQRRS